MKIDPYLSSCTKLKSKGIKDLNIKPITLDLIEEKVESTLEHVGTEYHFLNNPSSTDTERNNKRDLLKLKSFCKAKDTANKTKQQLTE